MGLIADQFKIDYQLAKNECDKTRKINDEINIALINAEFDKINEQKEDVLLYRDILLPEEKEMNKANMGQVEFIVGVGSDGYINKEINEITLTLNSEGEEEENDHSETVFTFRYKQPYIERKDTRKTLPLSDPNHYKSTRIYSRTEIKNLFNTIHDWILFGLPYLEDYYKNLTEDCREKNRQILNSYI